MNLEILITMPIHEIVSYYHKNPSTIAALLQPTFRGAIENPLDMPHMKAIAELTKRYNKEIGETFNSNGSPMNFVDVLASTCTHKSTIMPWDRFNTLKLHQICVMDVNNNCNIIPLNFYTRDINVKEIQAERKAYIYGNVNLILKGNFLIELVETDIEFCGYIESHDLQPVVEMIREKFPHLCVVV